MRILIDMGHPAHVHVFRNAIRELEGHGVRGAARTLSITPVRSPGIGRFVCVLPDYDDALS